MVTIKPLDDDDNGWLSGMLSEYPVNGNLSTHDITTAYRLLVLTRVQVVINSRFVIERRRA